MYIARANTKFYNSVCIIHEHETEQLRARSFHGRLELESCPQVPKSPTGRLLLQYARGVSNDANLIAHLFGTFCYTALTKHVIQ